MEGNSSSEAAHRLWRRWAVQGEGEDCAETGAAGRAPQRRRIAEGKGSEGHGGRGGREQEPAAHSSAGGAASQSVHRCCSAERLAQRPAYWPSPPQAGGVEREGTGWRQGAGRRALWQRPRAVGVDCRECYRTPQRSLSSNGCIRGRQCPACRTPGRVRRPPRLPRVRGAVPAVGAAASLSSTLSTAPRHPPIQALAVAAQMARQRCAAVSTVAEPGAAVPAREPGAPVPSRECHAVSSACHSAHGHTASKIETQSISTRQRNAQQGGERRAQRELTGTKQGSRCASSSSSGTRYARTSRHMDEQT